MADQILITPEQGEAQKFWLSLADKAEAAQKSCRSKLGKTIHEYATCAIRIVAVDSKFFTAHEEAVADLQKIRKDYERLCRGLSGPHKIDTPSLRIFARMAFISWGFLQDKYPDKAGIIAR